VRRIEQSPELAQTFSAIDTVDKIRELTNFISNAHRFSQPVPVFG
jgi:hypothetical protein